MLMHVYQVDELGLALLEGALQMFLGIFECIHFYFAL